MLLRLYFFQKPNLLEIGCMTVYTTGGQAACRALTIELNQGTRTRLGECGPGGRVNKEWSPATPAFTPARKISGQQGESILIMQLCVLQVRYQCNTNSMLASPRAITIIIALHLYRQSTTRHLIFTERCAACGPVSCAAADHAVNTTADYGSMADGIVALVSCCPIRNQGSQFVGYGYCSRQPTRSGVEKWLYIVGTSGRRSRAFTP